MLLFKTVVMTFGNEMINTLIYKMPYMVEITTQFETVNEAQG